jgi:CubicO group peptidase (beta-lactamase class C family)
MSARGAARLYAALLGYVDGVNLVSPERLRTMAAPAFSGTDQVMGFTTEWALGYSPARLGNAPPRPGSTFGMVGSNGTAVYADIDSGVAIAVMRNHILGDFSAVTAIDNLVTDHYHRSCYPDSPRRTRRPVSRRIPTARVLHPTAAPRSGE